MKEPMKNGSSASDKRGSRPTTPETTNTKVLRSHVPVTLEVPAADVQTPTVTRTQGDDDGAPHVTTPDMVQAVTTHFPSSSNQQQRLEQMKDDLEGKEEEEEGLELANGKSAEREPADIVTPDRQGSSAGAQTAPKDLILAAIDAARALHKTQDVTAAQVLEALRPEVEAILSNGPPPPSALNRSEHELAWSRDGGLPADSAAAAAASPTASGRTKADAGAAAAVSKGDADAVGDVDEAKRGVRPSNASGGGASLSEEEQVDYDAAEVLMLFNRQGYTAEDLDTVDTSSGAGRATAEAAAADANGGAARAAAAAPPPPAEVEALGTDIDTATGRRASKRKRAPNNRIYDELEPSEREKNWGKGRGRRAKTADEKASEKAAAAAAAAAAALPGGAMNKKQRGADPAPMPLAPPVTLELLRTLRDHHQGRLVGMELLVLNDGEWISAKVHKSDIDFKKVVVKYMLSGQVATLNWHKPETARRVCIPPPEHSAAAAAVAAAAMQQQAAAGNNLLFNGMRNMLAHAQMPGVDLLELQRRMNIMRQLQMRGMHVPGMAGFGLPQMLQQGGNSRDAAYSTLQIVNAQMQAHLQQARPTTPAAGVFAALTAAGKNPNCSPGPGANGGMANGSPMHDKNAAGANALLQNSMMQKSLLASLQQSMMGGGGVAESPGPAPGTNNNNAATNSNSASRARCSVGARGKGNGNRDHPADSQKGRAV